MSAFHKSFAPSHGMQGVSHSSSNSNLNSALGVNYRSPRSFHWFGFGSQLRTLSHVRPRQGGAQNKGTSSRWAGKKKTKEAEHYPQKSTGFGEQANRDEGPSMQQIYGRLSNDYMDDYMEAREKRTLCPLDDEVYDHMPPACDVVWKESRQAWLDLAIDQPITLNNGECTVHILGIFHDVPTNASALRALVEAVQPDTIAIELSPPNIKSVRTLARKLAPQLDKLVALEFPSGIREAHTALSPQDRCRWREEAFKERHVDDPISRMLHGRVPWIELLASAHLAPSEKNGISLEGIDLDRRYRARQVLEKPVFEYEYVGQRQWLLGPSADSFYKLGANPAFYEWQENTAKMELELLMLRIHTYFLEILGVSSMSLEEKLRIFAIEKEAESRMTGKAALYARSQGDTRNLHMLGRLQQLAVGPRPRKCIVAVVGQAHVAPMRELAARNKM